jgi:hypothetical protein
MQNTLPKLDPYEQKVFNDLTSKGMESERALKVLINNVEGDYSQLSKGLLDYGIKQGLIKGEL